MPPPAPDPDEIPIGLDGAAMLVLSLAVMMVSGGLTLAAAFAVVWRTARVAPSEVATAPAWALVLGQSLDRSGAPPALFRARLDRARRLAERWPELRLVILGGHSSAGRLSEAEAGRRHLVAAGVAARRILLEDRSRHTLENLVQFRASGLAGPGESPPLLITNRFHLARSALLARGLGIAHVPCAAEDRWAPRLTLAGPLLKEALLIQWYMTGRLFARWTRNKRMAARIS